VVVVVDVVVNVDGTDGGCASVVSGDVSPVAVSSLGVVCVTVSAVVARVV
jgi:hypothetical protein